jgi:5'(3')-deoxyribonucleotidase
MSRPIRILLDMDGVGTDFVGAFMTLVGMTATQQAKVYEEWTPGEYNINRVLGLSGNAMWQRISKAGIEFWSDMPEYPWFDKFYADLSAIAPVTFCTSPGSSHTAAAGKVIWLQKKFGDKFNKYVLTPHKELLSMPGNILIDDCDENINEFNKGEGMGILFPRPWNTAGRSESPEDACERIRRRVFLARESVSWS